MATYAIGDLQGCFDTLQTLLRAIHFDRDRDRLWFAGDLVNRGPKSLECLRWVREHEDCAVSVLGNHDLHLIARAHDAAAPKSKDTIDDVLSAPARDELVDWLRRRPFAHAEDGFLMLHAGVLPAWDEDRVLELARETEAAFTGEDFPRLIRALGDKRPVEWSDDLDREARVEATARILCNLRTCTPDGQPAFDFSAPPHEAPPDRIPWYDFPERQVLRSTVVCGHWAAQGLVVRDDMIALDTAAVWGSALTAVDLGTRTATSVPLVDDVPPSVQR